MEFVVIYRTDLEMYFTAGRYDGVMWASDLDLAYTYDNVNVAKSMLKAFINAEIPTRIIPVNVHVTIR